ncbi:plasmid mobilization protein [Epibacterium ulvae]|uniref:plasmid mobilization protein n=1 Tax=Epibacterium ulvae TaxID=1156985 RepID=UPI00248F4CC6|nr:plasmid mobilization relaxosome protein MobC [Epibacterium ulvae]
MRKGKVKTEATLTAAHRAAAGAPTKTKASKRRELSPLTLRLTVEERARLEELAAGMTLSAYVRACVFAEKERLRATRPADAMAEKKALAEVMGLLGHSRIASNLNQLAHHANLGLMIEDDRAKDQIAEANQHLLAIRTALMAALGKSRRSG